MNWLQKISAPIRTQDLPKILAKSLEYEIGGEWEAEAKNWTEDLEDISRRYGDEDNRLSQEKGYSTSFWITCKTGDGMFGKKWGVSVNFTVTSGTSNTMFDSETGGWDFSITANVQRNADSAYTPASPYALLMEVVGAQEDMKTIQDFAQFVKQAIWDSQSDNDEDDGFDNNDDDPDLIPDWPKEYNEDEYTNNETEEEMANVRNPRIRGRRTF